jgi:hypothetical protein
MITPDNSPDRFTEHEAELFRAGKCGWMVTNGMPWMEWCEQPSKPDADFGVCAEHDLEIKLAKLGLL